MTLAHVTLPTRRFDETVEFFETVLEFPRVLPPDEIAMRAMWFQIGRDEQIHVLEIDGVPDPVADGEFGRHVALRLRQARWLHIRDRLTAANFQIIAPQRQSRENRFFVLDPNGYCFEFVCDPTF